MENPNAFTKMYKFPEVLSNVPGWWFGTFFIFHNIWDNPSH